MRKAKPTWPATPSLGSPQSSAREQDTTATSSSLMEATAHSNASQTSPLPKTNSSVRSSTSTASPTLTESTRSVQVPPSRHFVQASRARSDLFMTVPSFSKDTSVVSRNSCSSSSHAMRSSGDTPSGHGASSPKATSAVHCNRARSPRLMDTIAASRSLAQTRPRPTAGRGAPTVCSKASMSFKATPLSARISLYLNKHSWPIMGLRLSTGRSNTRFTTMPSPKMSQQVTQSSNSTS
mmetsp:Transcript_26388/g.83575  ORF Transcript_26388/g.83575 Transcript_26388/m.83575 type:complete len:237 (+) Transcript_26388:824-1534(+)